MEIAMWRLHRKIGMSGELLLRAFADEVGREFDAALKARLESLHTEHFSRLRGSIKAFPEVPELFADLQKRNLKFAIATSGDLKDVQPLLELARVPHDVPVISKKDASTPKPDPALFLKAAQKLGSRSEDTIVVGDSVWDMLA